jgi:hypothetical protein
VIKFRGRVRYVHELTIGTINAVVGHPVIAFDVDGGTPSTLWGLEGREVIVTITDVSTAASPAPASPSGTCTTTGILPGDSPPPS